MKPLWKVRDETHTEVLVPVKQGEILNPSGMIAVLDSQFIDYRLMWQMDINDSGRGLFPTPQSMRNSVIGFTVPQMGPYDFGPFLQDATVVSGYKRLHNGMFNMLFCDGHVEAMRPADLFSAQPEMLRRWDRDNQP